MTNKEYANSKDFTEKCEKVGVKPTKRQASKYRNKKGCLCGKSVQLAWTCTIKQLSIFNPFQFFDPLSCDVRNKPFHVIQQFLAEYQESKDELINVRNDIDILWNKIRTHDFIKDEDISRIYDDTFDCIMELVQVAAVVRKMIETRKAAEIMSMNEEVKKIWLD